MNPSENYLEELPNKEFKSMIITIFKQLKEDMNIFQENKNKEMSETWKSI